MSKKYEIELHVNTTQSDAATDRSVQVVGRVERAYKRAGDAQEAAAKRGAQAGFVSALKLDASATKLSTKIAAEANKQAATQERATRRAAYATEREAKRSASPFLMAV